MGRLVGSNQTANEAISKIFNNTRTKLTADTTYYIDLAGDNSNDGLSSGSALASITEFVRILQEDLDLNGHRVTALLAPGDYSSEGLIHLPTLVGAEPITCQVTDSNVSNAQVIIKGSSPTDCFIPPLELDQAGYFGIISVKILFTAGYNGYGLSCSRGGILDAVNIEVEIPEGTGAINAIRAEEYGYIKITGDKIKFIGYFTYALFYARKNSYIEVPIDGNQVVYEVNSPLISDAFAFADSNSTIDLKRLSVYNPENRLSLGHITVRDSYIWVPSEVYDSATIYPLYNSNYGYVNSKSFVKADATNVSFSSPSSLTATNVKEAIDELAFSINNIERKGLVNVENLTTDKTLTATDATYQYFTNTANAPLSLFLPTSPAPNQRFLISNERASTNSITIFSSTLTVSLLPGDRYEIIHNGTKWVSIDNWQFFGEYGEPHYFDPRANRVLSKQVSLDGFGANGTNNTGYSVRRYNGVPLTPTLGMALPHGIVITEASLTAQSSTASTLIAIEHYDMDGNNGQIVNTFPISHQNNRMGYFTGTRIYIPPFRRLAFFINGSLSNFQGQYSYRKCFT